MPDPLRVLSVVGTRPNLMKTAPVVAALDRRPDEFAHVLVHTGQHYDHAMSRAFFEDLELPEPDFFLGVGSGSHTEQTGPLSPTTCCPLGCIAAATSLDSPSGRASTASSLLSARTTVANDQDATVNTAIASIRNRIGLSSVVGHVFNVPIIGL